jgi:hypothetical protein
MLPGKLLGSMYHSWHGQGSRPARNTRIAHSIQSFTSGR